MNLTEADKVIQRNAKLRGLESVHLSANWLQQAEVEDGSVTARLRRLGVPDRPARIPVANGDAMLRLVNDAAVSEADPMIVERGLLGLLLTCFREACGFEVRSLATDEGADRVGLAMVRHSLKSPGCSGYMEINSVKAWK